MQCRARSLLSHSPHWLGLGWDRTAGHRRAPGGPHPDPAGSTGQPASQHWPSLPECLPGAQILSGAWWNNKTHTKPFIEHICNLNSYNICIK